MLLYCKLIDSMKSDIVIRIDTTDTIERVDESGKFERLEHKGGFWSQRPHSVLSSTDVSMSAV